MTPPDPDRLGETFALPVDPAPPGLAAALASAAMLTASAATVAAVVVGRGLAAAAALAVGAAAGAVGTLATRPRVDDTPAAVRYADTVWDDAGTDAAAAALVVWEHLQRAGELPPSAVWVLVTDPGGDDAYAYRHARYLSDLFEATDPRPLTGPDDAPGWLAVVAPAVPSDLPPDLLHPDDATAPPTLVDIAEGARGRTRVVAVAVTQTGEVGTVSAPLVLRRGRWTVGAITPADGPATDGPDVTLAPWLATIAGTTLRTPEDGPR